MDLPILLHSYKKLEGMMVVVLTRGRGQVATRENIGSQ